MICLSLPAYARGRLAPASANRAACCCCSNPSRPRQTSRTSLTSPSLPSPPPRITLRPSSLSPIVSISSTRRHHHLHRRRLASQSSLFSLLVSPGIVRIPYARFPPSNHRSHPSSSAPLRPFLQLSLPWTTTQTVTRGRLHPANSSLFPPLLIPRQISTLHHGHFCCLPYARVHDVAYRTVQDSGIYILSRYL